MSDNSDQGGSWLWDLAGYTVFFMGTSVAAVWQFDWWGFPIAAVLVFGYFLLNHFTTRAEDPPPPS